MKNTILTLLALAVIVPVASAEPGDYNCPEEAAKCAHQMAEHWGQRGFVGISMDDKEGGNVMLTKIVEGSPAEAAGLQKGDILRGLNGIDYTEANEEKIGEEYKSFKPGDTATFKVERDGQTLDIEVELAPIPKAILAQWVGQHVLEYHQVAETDGEEEAETDSP